MLHQLKATPDTVHWGFFDRSLTPVLKVQSGAYIEMETISANCGEAPDLLMDEMTKSIYEAIPAHERSPGPHLMTGPIWVEGAEPGDMLEVRYLRMKPRLPYGTNIAGYWGGLYDRFQEKERVTVYKLDEHSLQLVSLFGYDVPYKKSWTGMVIQPHEATRTSSLQGFRLPYRPQIGNAGVAPVETGKISTIPPGKHGGNIDNRHIGPGSVMYYPVGVEGALFSAGDAHLAQGDGEINGTGIECSMDLLIQVIVRKDFYFSSPLLETDLAWIVHAFDKDLNAAMRQASLNMLQFLCDQKGLSEFDAYSLMSVAADFVVTQVVDELKGIHVSIPKSVFPPSAFE